MAFEPYIATGRVFKDELFDFLIADETAKAWYDGPLNSSCRSVNGAEGASVSATRLSTAGLIMA
jgi:hypothetical protein